MQPRARYFAYIRSVYTKNVIPSVYGLSILTLALVDTVERVMPKCPNKFTLASLIDISGVLPIVPTIMFILLSLSPFKISQS